MKKLLGLLGIIMITGNAIPSVIATAPNRKHIIKKRQNNENISTTPKAQDEQQSQFLANSDSKVDIIEKEITLNENYSDNIQKMLQELIDENYIDPLRSINMGGLISKELDNKTIISKLEELEPKMANWINWIKKQQNNKDKILILTLKNSDNKDIKLVINLNNFYLLGFINKDKYFYFDDELLEKVKEHNQNEITELEKIKTDLEKLNKLIKEKSRDKTEKENLEWEIKEKLNKLKELDKLKEQVKLEKNPEEIKKLEKNIKNINELIKEQINKSKYLNKLNKELIEARKAKLKEQINETNKKIEKLKKEIFIPIPSINYNNDKKYLDNKIKNLQGEGLKTEEIKTKTLNTKVTENYNCQKINLNYTGAYSEDGLDVVIKEKDKPTRGKDIIISKDTLNNAIANLENYNNKQNENIKNDLVRLIFITSEAMRFQCDEKTLKIFAEIKNTDELKKIIIDSQNILKNIQEKIFNKNQTINWNDYTSQLRGDWKKYSEQFNKFRIEIWNELNEFKKILNFINDSKYEINEFITKILDDNNAEKWNEILKIAQETNLIQKINKYDLDNKQTIIFLLSIKKDNITWKKRLDKLFPLKKWKEIEFGYFKLLHVTILQRNLDLTKLLINIDAVTDVNIQDKNILNPLYFAIETENIEIIKLLIDNGADVNLRDKNDLTPLHFAIETENIEIIKLLIDNGADPNFLDCNNSFISPLHYAIIKNKKEMIKVLLKSKKIKNNINNKSYLNIGCLHWASLNLKNINNLEITKLLIDNGADVNLQDENGTTPIYYAISTDNIEIVKLLIDNGADVKNINKNGLTPLYYAIILDKKEMVQFLINNGADVNLRDKNGLTPLHFAIDENNKEMVQFLINNGADVNIKITSTGATILHYAIIKNKKEMVKLLINNGADVNKGVDSLIPLNYAIGEKKEMIQLLIDNGADVNLQDENGLTPLYYAINTENIEIVKLLLTNGADVNKGVEGLTPLLYSKYMKYIKIENLLKDFQNLKNKIELLNEQLKKTKINEQKTKINNSLKEYLVKLKQLLKIELSNVITKTELGEITDNQNETILNRIAELNLQVDISQVKIQENSITDTAASIESIDKIYTDDTVKVTFTLGKKPSNINDTKKIITEDEYKKQGERTKGSSVASKKSNNSNTNAGRSQPQGSSSKRVRVGEQAGTSGTQNKNTKTTNQNNLYDVPSDNSCLFWSVATAYLLPVRNNNDNQEFENRFIQLFGEENLKYLQFIQKLLKQDNLENNSNTQLWYQDKIANNLVTNVFRNRVVDYIEENLDTVTTHTGQLTFRNLIQENNEVASNYLERMRESSTWGGTPEIIAMSNILNSNISVNNDSPYQPINQNSSNTINIFHVNGNHYNFDIPHQISSTNSEIESINNNNKTQQDLTDAVTENKLGKISDNQEQTILNRARELNPNLNIDKINVTDIRSTTALIVSNDENIYSGCVIISFIIATQNNLENISSNQEHTIKESIINSQEKIATVISNQSVGGGTASVLVNKQISTNIVNSQTTVKNAINKYNSLSKEEKQQKLNEINQHYQNLSEDDKKVFKDKLRDAGLGLTSTGISGAGILGISKMTGISPIKGLSTTANYIKNILSTTRTVVSSETGEAVEMTPLLSESTVAEGLTAAETLSVTEGATVVATEGAIIGAEAGTAAALAPETLGLSLVIGGLVIAGTAILWWINSDHTIVKHESHNQYNEIEKYYKFLAHDQLKLDININEWNKIKQIYQENSNNYQEFKNKIKSEINNFYKEDHSGWGGSIIDEDINTLINILYNHFQEINNHFSSNSNHGWKIVTNTIGSYFIIEEE
ncbi:ankyrin repeat domain-containing protein [Spiroplasma endosymbiont of Poecilobothrus nobilitatus]|uniref:ankyrin repeat domain-containing protein n=1 Tax=Spiroplasma endosymbiont of Poecilobothrus nobilitatus TaxID=1209220 RepID=UPI00313E09D2